MTTSTSSCLENERRLDWREERKGGEGRGEERKRIRKGVMSKV
jgi:hypothetical protein